MKYDLGYKQVNNLVNFSISLKTLKKIVKFIKNLRKK